MKLGNKCHMTSHPQLPSSFFFLLVLSPSLNVSICPHLYTPASHIQHAGLQAPIATIPWSGQQIGTSITLRL